MDISIFARFKISVLMNLARAGIGMATVIIVARSFGPADYGLLTFLMATFQAVKQLTDLSSSTAFYTFLSQETRSKRFILTFLLWLAFQFVIILVCLLIMPERVLSIIWPGASRDLVMLALFASFMQYGFWPVAMQMAEAQRSTAKVQWLYTFTTLIHLGIVLILVTTNSLNIQTLLMLLSLEWAVSGAIAFRFYKPLTRTSDSTFSKPVEIASVASQYYKFCKPLIPYVLVGFVYEFTDRWMLQQWAGSVEQAYFSVGQQFVSVISLFTASAMLVLWKEFAEECRKGNIEKIRLLYLYSSRTLFLFASAIAGLLAPWSVELVTLIVGDQYSDGAATLLLLLFFPAYQAVCQMYTTILYATSRTRAQANIGITFMFFGILLAYILLAKNDFLISGFGLGSLGLALKIVAVQILQCSVLGYYIYKQFGFEMDFILRIKVLWMFVALGWVLSMVFSFLPIDGPGFNYLFPIYVVSYTAISFILLTKFSSFFGFSSFHISKYFFQVVIQKP